MLSIKRDQRSHLGEAAFEDRTVVHFRIVRPEVAYSMSERELRRRIRHGFAKGRSYGLTWEYSLTLFLAHMLVINPRFDEHPAMQAVLRDESIPPDERVDALTSDRVSKEEWDEAEAIGDPDEYWAAVASSGGAPEPLGKSLN